MSVSANMVLQRAVWLAGIVGIVVVTVLAYSKPAQGHSGSGKEYRSRVLRIEPDIPIDVRVEGGDDQLRFENKGSKTLDVYGYGRREAECGSSRVNPQRDLYIQITPRGVSVNTNNRAYYENKGRYGAAVPAGVGKGKPKWKVVTEGVGLYRYHDHRIHWMAKTVPPSVDKDKAGRQKVTTWKVPVRYGTTQACVIGQLDYIGGKASSTGVLEWALLALAIVGLIGIVAAALRQRSRHKHSNNDAPPRPDADSGPPRLD